MNVDRYNILIKGINFSLQMKLDVIRRSLTEGKAACLVGAGFSKNAKVDDATPMKNWFELADDFYELLYGEKTADKDV